MLDRITSHFDYCLIDTPPSLSSFVELSLVAANEILLPLKANEIDVKATEKFLNTVDAIKDINPNLSVSGIVFTMIKKGSKSQEIYTKMFVGHELEEKVCETKIRDTVKLGLSSTKGADIFSFDPKGIGSQDYKKLAQEVLTWN